MADSEDTSKLPFPVSVLAWWGDFCMNVFRFVGGVTFLLLDVVRWMYRAIVLRRVRFGFKAVVSQIVRVGTQAIPIVMLVSACIGFILALQMFTPLDEFGQSDKIANIVGVAVFRELGPLMAAIVLSGFAGASIASEIGTMKVSEEIDALEAHALNPVRYLVVPRVLATMLSLIALTVIGDVTAVASAGVLSAQLGVPPQVYMDNLVSQLDLTDFFTGLAKAGVFGVLLSAIACHYGLRVEGGSGGVGIATTKTVVQGVIWVIIFDLLFTFIFFAFE